MVGARNAVRMGGRRPSRPDRGPRPARARRAAAPVRSARSPATAPHLAAILVLGAAIALRVPFWPLLLVPHGILIVFLFTALHECSHRTAFRTEWVNRVVAGVAGFLVLVPPEWFRCFHAAHHRFTHDPARDPELAVPEPRTRWEYAWRLTGLPLWRALAAHAAGQRRRPLSRRLCARGLTGGGGARGAADAGRLRRCSPRARSPCAATCCCGSGWCRRCSGSPSCAPI